MSSISVVANKDLYVLASRGIAEQIQNNARKKGLGICYNSENQLFTLTNSAEMRRDKICSLVEKPNAFWMPQVQEDLSEKGEYQFKIYPLFSLTDEQKLGYIVSEIGVFFGGDREG